MDFEQQLDEAIDHSERRKRGRTMKRYKNKIKRGKERSDRKRADNGRIEKRSKRSARKVVRDKITNGKNYDDMSTAQKKSIDKRVERRKKAIERISKRLKNKKRRQDAGLKESVGTFERAFKTRDRKKALVIQALDYLHKMVTSKGDEQTVAGYAFDIKRSFNLPISARQLADLYKTKYDPKNEPDFDANALWEDSSCAFISKSQIKAFESILDKLFEKHGIDFQFTKHFGERINNARNTPCITLRELGEFFKRIYAKGGKRIKDSEGAEAVLKDMQKHLNIPVVVRYDRANDEIDVVAKTIMRKKGFKSPDKAIGY